MKKHISSLLFFIIFALGYSQNNSLLWEISGNGLSKKSYIYGTMHVSKKVAFRLDDIFYSALSKSEAIALESNPTKWLESSYDKLGLLENNLSRTYTENFYTNLFKLSPTKELVFRRTLMFDNRMINGYLYRKNAMTDDYEEETYLDMFIFQAGKKNNKPIISLEDIEEANFLTTKASYSPRKIDVDDWLQKRFKNKSPFLIQEDVYRKRNIELLDSIGSAINTKFYRKHMLFDRNKNMVNVLDSVMRKKSVFSGVGAAHLGGKKGMLQMLKDLGYTVKPLHSKQSTYSKNEKDKLDNLFTQPELSLQSTPDNFITLKSFDKLREFTFDGLKFYMAPDMTNGAYLLISRLNTFDYLPSDDDRMTIAKINDLLYENIPGEIIEKKEFSAPYPGISILNKTKKGDYQNHHIYKTPLEIIIIKFGGKKDYVLKHKDSIFNSIIFKKESSKTRKFNDSFEKYSLELPENFITDNSELPGRKLIQGSLDSNFFFFQESPVHDTEYIEDDTFEAKFIVENFYKDLDILNSKGQITSHNGYKSYNAVAKIDSTTNKNLYLKSVIKDASYYLLGFVGDNDDDCKTYFNSFKFKKAEIENFQVKKDTSLLFTVNSTSKALPEVNSYLYKKNKPYDELIKKATYLSKTNDKVFVTKLKFHDLQMYKNIDSLWNEVKEQSIGKNPYQNDTSMYISNEKKEFKNGCNTYTFVLKDSFSSKEIIIKYLQKKGVVFKLQALTDSLGQKSKFVSEFFNSFKPIDSVLGKDIFTDKTNQFYDALKASDSMVLDGYQKINFEKKHVPQLREIINTLNFKDDQINIKIHLLNTLIVLDKSEITLDLLKSIYYKSYSKPNIQNEILNALLDKKESYSYALFKELIENDIPVSNRSSSIHINKRLTKQALETRKKLFPQLFELTTISEYKTLIYGLLTRLLDSSIIKPKFYKSIKKRILNDAKIELKRSFLPTFYKGNSDIAMENYTKLLFPFRNENSVKTFYNKLISSENYSALTTLYVLFKKAKQAVVKQLDDVTLHNEKAQAELMKKLNKNDLLDATLFDSINAEKFAKSLVISNFNQSSKEKTVTLLKKNNIITDTNISLTLFVFKATIKNERKDKSFLHFVALTSTPQKQYNTTPFYLSNANGKMLRSDSEIDETIEKTMLLIKHKSRKRLTFSRF